MLVEYDFAYLSLSIRGHAPFSYIRLRGLHVSSNTWTQLQITST